MYWTYNNLIIKETSESFKKEEKNDQILEYVNKLNSYEVRKVNS